MEAKRYKEGNKILIVLLPDTTYEGMIRANYQDYSCGDFMIHTNKLENLKQI